MSDNRAKLRKPPWHRLPFLSVRARLLVLAFFAITPLMLERVHGLEHARAEHTERAHADVMELARRGAEAQREIIYSVRALLQVVAHADARMSLDQPDCNNYLTDLTANIPWLHGLSFAGPDGKISCSTQPLAIGLNVSDRPHFQHALHARDFALSDYMINQVHQAPSLIATYPAIKGDGSLTGVVLASINLQWLGDLMTTAAQRTGASILLFDSSGTLLASSPQDADLIGKTFADASLVRAMLATDEGTTMTAGLHGDQRIFGYVRVPWTEARLAVGLDGDAVHSGIDRKLGIAYLQLAAFGIFVLLAAWFGGEQLIVRPIRSLARTAARFGRGDLHVRATQQSWLAEFEPLAAALDDMASKLATREEELRIANQHLDELASLDGLTGLANRRGFDRQLECEWRRAEESGAPLGLMMIDIDHFKLYNDCYGHVAGDSCLRSVGETLSLVTLETAVLVARYGGEEFALLLPGLDMQRVAALAEEARRSIEDLLITHVEAPCGQVTVSIGVESLVPQSGQPPAYLLEAADSALYMAKRRGRNRVIAGAPPLLSAVS
jgi:diguanylate cyclase (GGDEF)-like protein